MGTPSLTPLEEKQPTLWLGLCLLSGCPGPGSPLADLCVWARGNGLHPAPPRALITQDPQWRVLRAPLRLAAPVATQQAGPEAGVLPGAPGGPSRRPGRTGGRGRGEGTASKPRPRPAPSRSAVPGPACTPRPASCRLPRALPPLSPAGPTAVQVGGGPVRGRAAGAEPPTRRPRWGPPPLFLFLPSSSRLPRASSHPCSSAPFLHVRPPAQPTDERSWVYSPLHYSAHAHPASDGESDTVSAPAARHALGRGLGPRAPPHLPRDRPGTRRPGAGGGGAAVGPGPAGGGAARPHRCPHPPPCLPQ